MMKSSDGSEVRRRRTKVVASSLMLAPASLRLADAHLRAIVISRSRPHLFMILPSLLIPSIPIILQYNCVPCPYDGHPHTHRIIKFPYNSPNRGVKDAHFDVTELSPPTSCEKCGAEYLVCYKLSGGWRLVL